MGNNISPIPFIVLGIYILIVAILAFAPQKKKSKIDFEEFYTGSKSFGGFVVALIMLATYYAGSTWTGWQGFVAEYGVFGAYVIPYCVASGILFYFVGERIWPLGKKYGLNTMPDLLELRYDSIGVKLLSGFIGVLMDVTVVTTEIVTLGYIVNVATSGYISITLGAAGAIILLALYLIWGGIKSIGRVDTFNGLLMLVGSIFVAFFVAYLYYGGVPEIFETVLKHEPEQFTLIGAEGYGTAQHWTSFAVLCTMGALCWPELYMKMYVGKGVNEIRFTGILTAVSGIWCVFFLITGFAAIGVEYIGQPGFDDPQSSLLLLVYRSGNMIVFGMVAVFILAASVATVDGILLADAGAFTNDVIFGVKRLMSKAPKLGSDEYSTSEIMISQKKIVFMTRIIIVIIAILALIVSQMNIPMLVFLIVLNYQGVSLLFPILIGGVFWKKATSTGALAGLIAGIILTVALLLIDIEPFGFIPGILGVMLDAIVFIIVSIATQKKDFNEKIMIDFFGKSENANS